MIAALTALIVLLFISNTIMAVLWWHAERDCRWATHKWHESEAYHKRFCDNLAKLSKDIPIPKSETPR